jgi:putative transposase
MFGFVAKHRGAWPLAILCEALGVTRTVFSAWLTRPRSRRSLDDERLTELARRSFLDSDRTYGARRYGGMCWRAANVVACTVSSA